MHMQLPPDLGPAPPAPPPPKKEPGEKSTDAWFSELKDDRMECMLKTPEIRLRVSGPAERVWEAVQLFEEWTGRQVAGDWKRPPKRGARQIPGQADIFMDLRSSDGETDE
jgi:hypothetical protein